MDFSTGALANAGINLVSSIFGRNSTKNMPQYNAPQVPDFQSGLPSYASLFGQAPGAYDLGNSQLYGQLNQQSQSGQLPPELRQQLLGQAQGDAQNAYNTANSQLTFDEDRAQRTGAEQMNKLGLLSSGALGVRQGLTSDSYARQRGSLLGNLQSQMGAASTNLMQQEFGARQNVQQLLSGLEGQRQNASVTGRGQLLNFAQGERQNMGNLAQQQYGYQQQNATNAYNGQLNQYNAGQAYNGNIADALKSGISAYSLMGNSGGQAGGGSPWGQMKSLYGAQSRRIR